MFRRSRIRRDNPHTEKSPVSKIYFNLHEQSSTLNGCRPMWTSLEALIAEPRLTDRPVIRQTIEGTWRNS